VSPGGRGRLDALTSFRFFAAAMIVVHHVKWYFTFLDPLSKTVQLDLGVSFFFVLSGFVLFYNYPHLDTLKSRRRFLLMRVARIWPLHLFLVSVIVMFLDVGWSYPMRPGLFDYSAVFILLQSWVPFPKTFFAVNGVSWSISVEMFFYAMFPLLIADFARTWWWKLAVIAGCIAGILTLATAFHLAPLVMGPDENKLSVDALAFIFPPSRLLEFYLGICACSLFRALHHRVRLGVVGWSIVEACALAATFVAMNRSLHVGYDLQQSGLGIAVARWVSESGCAPVFALLIVTFALSRGCFNMILSKQILVFLGEISFSIYMIHVTLFTVMRLHVLHNVIRGTLAGAIAYSICLVAVSAASWILIEQRGRALLIFLYDQVLRSKTGEAAPSPAS
jgi:peptidoglycan/LPS O-acetylase OafA/YrhL